MAFQIDLNEMPIPSPREAVNDAVSGAAVCVMCRKGVPLGKVADKATGELRPESKCFRCLIKDSNKGGGSGGGGGGEAGRFDINASPPREAEDGDVLMAVAGREGTGGGRYNILLCFPFVSLS